MSDETTNITIDSHEDKNATVRKREKVIRLLRDSGYTDDKAVLALPIENILNIKKITIDDLRNVIDLQKAIKQGKVFAYLCGSD